MQNKNHLNFVVLVGLFFGWGFVTVLNDLLTPILKQAFTLNQFQANFVSFAFFIAYFIGSMVYVISGMLGFTFFVRLGYKGLILLGLLLSAIGCLIFIPASIYKSFDIFLFGLFSLGFGFTFLQISANPLVIISGDESTGASRLNLAGGFNSLATTIGPVIGVYVFYQLLDVHTNHNNLKYPYIFLAVFFIILAGLIYKFLVATDTKEHSFSQDIGKPFALNHANLLFGMLAIFFYVGSEVSVGTNLVTYLKSPDTLGFADNIAGKLLAFYWGGAMIGRFLGGVALTSMSKIKKLFIMILITVSLTLLILTITGLWHHQLIYFIGFEILAIVIFVFINSARINLIIFAAINIINLAVASHLANSQFAVWSILSVGIFNSIMWPNIFDLSIADLGKYKEQGSSFLIMMILGGACMPVAQGYLADKTNIITSFLVPLCGYIYILAYSVFYSKKQFNFIKNLSISNSTD